MGESFQDPIIPVFRISKFFVHILSIGKIVFSVFENPDFRILEF